MGFSRPEYWRGLPFSSPGDLPDPGIDPRSPALPPDSFFWLLWVLTAVRGLSLVGANEGYSLTEGLGLLIGVPSVTLGSAAAACPLRCPVAGGILIPGQGLNLSPLHRKVDS